MSEVIGERAKIVSPSFGPWFVPSSSCSDLWFCLSWSLHRSLNRNHIRIYQTLWGVKNTNNPNRHSRGILIWYDCCPSSSSHHIPVTSKWLTLNDGQHLPSFSDPRDICLFDPSWLNLRKWVVDDVLQMWGTLLIMDGLFPTTKRTNVNSSLSQTRPIRKEPKRLALVI